MNELKKLILVWLKKTIDKMYYVEYSKPKETLIREMFPWIDNVWEYKLLDTYIASHNNMNEIYTLIRVIHSFYRWEVNSLIANWKVDEINNYKWLLIFANSLKDFYDVYLSDQTK